MCSADHRRGTEGRFPKKELDYAVGGHDAPATTCTAIVTDGICAKYIIAAFPSVTLMRSTHCRTLIPQQGWFGRDMNLGDF